MELFIFTGAVNSVVSFHTRQPPHAIVTSAFTTDTVTILMIYTAAYCLVLRATNYRDVMGTRV